MRVALVDPAAFTPQYDHALASALALAGLDVELIDVPFPVRRAAAARRLRATRAASIPSARGSSSAPGPAFR